jgi:2-keto-3-deoxy-L-fuconate dehydrogenase
MRLDGKVAVITGAASGIGLASAKAFAAAGAELALVDRDKELLKRAGAALGATAPLTLVGDVGDEVTVGRHAEDVLARHGRIDVLMTCAGWSTGLGVADCDLPSWEAVLRTNLTGTFLWARAAVRAMHSSGRGGALVFVGSQLAIAGGRSNAAHLASKGAVVSLAKSMALDHAGEGIRVNVVVPGAIDTPLLARAFERAPDAAAARARSVARHPLRRLGQADEVANAALFLASDASSFTTGSCVMVDSGWLPA